MEGKWKRGTVRWFNPDSGRGAILCDRERQTYPVHYSAIQSDKKWRKLKENQKVEFIVYEDFEFAMVEKVREITK